MSSKFETLLKISVAGAVLLSVGACKAADKGQGALKSQGVAALNLSKSEASVFAKYFQPQDCEVGEMEALGALAGLGLGESGANDLTFESRDFSGGLVTYRDLAVADEGDGVDVFRADTAVFHCPGMGDEAPSYARLDVTDGMLSNEGTTITFATLNISNPTPDAAAAIINGMISPQSENEGDIGFDAISATDVTIKSDDIYGSLEALSWGETRDENGLGKADLTIGNLDVTIPGENGAQDMTIDFKGMSGRNLNIGGKIDPQAAMSPDAVVGSMIGNINAFEKPYDELIIETMKLNSEGFEVDFGGIEGLTSEKDGVVTTRQSLKPTVVSLKPALADVPSFKRNYDIIKSLGFETLKMSGSSVTVLDSADDSITVSDGLFLVDDAFVLNFEYAAEGLAEMTAKAQSLSQTPGTPDLMAAYDPLMLRNFRLTLEDNSIIERGLKLATEMTGQNENNIKLGLSMAVFAVAGFAENDVQAEVYAETVGAFSEFVNKGGTLTLEANPPAPFAIAPLLSDEADDIDPAALGFSASQAGGSE